MSDTDVMEDLHDKLQEEISPTADEIPNILYHYTSCQGLIGILSSKGVFGTHYRELEDKTEVSYAMELIQSEITNIRSKEKVSPFKDLLDDVLSLFIKVFTVYDKSLRGVYTASFCEYKDKDDLWVKYAKKYSGFAIGIDPRKIKKNSLENALKHKTDHTDEFGIIKVNYEEKDQRKIIRSFIEYAVEYYKKLDISLGKVKFEVKNELTNGMIFYLPCIAPAFKNTKYSKELEWRFIQLIRKKESFPIKIFDFRENGKELIPIKEIVIGKENTLSKNCVREFLLGFGYNDGTMPDIIKLTP